MTTNFGFSVVSNISVILQKTLKVFSSMKSTLQLNRSESNVSGWESLKFGAGI